jgi:hypothetical protein
VLQQPFSGFFKYGLVCIIYSSGGLVDGLVIGKFCNPTHACYKVSLSLLSQAVITILAGYFLENYNL